MFQGIPAMMVSGGAPVSTPASSLLTGLRAYYKLEDTLDSGPNGLTLTNNNAVTFVSGKVNNCANFVAASSQHLTAADNAAFQLGTGDIGMAAWVKWTNDTSPGLFVLYGNWFGNGPMYGINQNYGNLQGVVGDGTVSIGVNGGVHNDGLWHLAVLHVDRTAKLLRIYTDNVLAEENDITTVTGTVNNSSGLDIGGQLGSTYLDGQIDEIGIWNRVLTSTERDTLWNAGAGITYPF